MVHRERRHFWLGVAGLCTGARTVGPADKRQCAAPGPGVAQRPSKMARRRFRRRRNAEERHARVPSRQIVPTAGLSSLTIQRVTRACPVHSPPRNHSFLVKYWLKTPIKGPVARRRT